jgi:hypothetical protein
MPALTVGGVTLECTDGGEEDKVKIGEQSRAFAGNLRGTERDEKATFSFTTMPTTAAIWASLSGVITLGAHVTCTGDILPSGSITASVVAKAKAIQGTSPVLYTITGSGQEV